MQPSVLNKNSLEAFTSTHEPILIGDNNSSLGVFFSMEDLGKLLSLKESIKDTINTGILSGIADMEEGRFSEYNDDFINEFDKELDTRLAHKL